MNKQEKIQVVEKLAHDLGEVGCYFVVDTQGLSVSDIDDFRRKCFEKGIKYKVVKNKLGIKSISKLGEAANEKEKYTDSATQILKGMSGFMMSKEVSSTPIKIIEAFRKDKENDLPLFKGAFVDGDFFVGSEHFETLSKLKSKQELIAEVVGLLQSPMKNVLSSLFSGKNKLSGILKTLSKRESKD